jgi:hypothetical protein
MNANQQLAEKLSRGAVTDTSVSFFGYTFNFYGLFILSLLLFFIFMLWRAQRNQRLDWVDIITHRGSNIVSLTKVLQLVGGVVGTWIVVQLTLQDQMTWEILAIYLAYVASIEGYSKFITAKYGLFGEKRPQENSKSAAVAGGAEFIRARTEQRIVMARASGEIPLEEAEELLQARIKTGAVRPEDVKQQ